MQQLNTNCRIQNVNHFFTIPETPFAVGKFGQIYKAKRISDDKIVALKKLPMFRYNMINREFHMWNRASLSNHDNIGVLLGRWADEDHVYIASEFLPEQGDALNQNWTMDISSHKIGKITYEESKKVIQIFESRGEKFVFKNNSA